jgi:ABC-type branched-subunit amino acid transport system substrate-binding protein
MYEESEKDFSIVILKTIKESPDFVLIISIEPSSSFNIVKALKESNYQGLIYVATDINDEKIAEFENVAEGVYFGGNAKLDYSKEFLDKFNNEYKTDPNLYNALGYMWAEVYSEMFMNNIDISKESIIKYVNNNAFAIMNFSYINYDVQFPMQTLVAKDGKLREVYVN